MTNNDTHKGNDMIHDDFDTEIQSDEMASISDEDWQEMVQLLGFDTISNLKFKSHTSHTNFFISE